VAVIGRLLNLTPRHLQRLATDGVIPKAARGRYELVPVVQGYVKYLQDLAAGKGDDARKTATTEYAIERAKKAQRENMKAAGELIPKTEIVAMIQGMFGHCRARLLAIPTKLAPLMDLLETTAEKKDAITEAIYDALQELSQTRAVFEGADGAGGGAGDNRATRRATAAAKPKREKRQRR